jgi:SAC3 family protein LENG8/THP3
LFCLLLLFFELLFFNSQTPVSASVTQPSPTGSIHSSISTANPALSMYNFQSTGQMHAVGQTWMNPYASYAAAMPYGYGPSTSLVPSTNASLIQSSATADQVTISKKPNSTRFSNPQMNPTILGNEHQSPQAPQTKVTHQPNPPKPVHQPASLKDYVKRSFALCMNDQQRDYVNKELKKIVEKVTSEGRLHIHRWDLEPPPTLETISIETTLNKFPIKTETIKSEVITTEGTTNVSGKKRKSRWMESDSNSVAISLPIPSSPSNMSATYKSVLVNEQVTDEELKQREKRASRFNTTQESIIWMPNSTIATTSTVVSTAKIPFQASNSKDLSNKQLKKMKKTAATINYANNPLYGNNNATDIDLESFKIVGTCQKLEKDYLRLTAPPLPSAVRPESVLRKSIQMLKLKWEKDEVDYVYMCSQLKSIRQDLTVQHIQNGKKDFFCFFDF